MRLLPALFVFAFTFFIVSAHPSTAWLQVVGVLCVILALRLRHFHAS